MAAVNLLDLGACRCRRRFDEILVGKPSEHMPELMNHGVPPVARAASDKIEIILRRVAPFTVRLRIAQRDDFGVPPE